MLSCLLKELTLEKVKYSYRELIFLTNHKIFFKSSTDMCELRDESVALVITSPPYPMIEMWNEVFSSQDPTISNNPKEGNFDEVFNNMHKLLYKVWDEVVRILMPGGIVCINIGDATKTINGIFKLYPNHVKIIDYFVNKGFCVLPDIIWRKQTNAPNKFMGSGMYPPGAYVTFEHEYILIFRKGDKRQFKNVKEKKLRQESAYFWEERNIWFSDIWDFKGTGQKLNGNTKRKRSGAFPFELAYRLINMYSIKNDIVVDPFLGTGTTTLAAIASERNSVGYEIENAVKPAIRDNIKNSIFFLNNYIDKKLEKHREFITEQIGQNKSKLYQSRYHDFYVKTRQETEIIINKLESIEEIDTNIYNASYTYHPTFNKNHKKNETLIKALSD